MDNGVKNTALRTALRIGPSRSGQAEQKEHIEFCGAKSLLVNERIFSFDHVFRQDIQQQELYDTIMRPLVAKVLRGYNCTALAYGQTGTGKSYSMGLNSENLSEEHVGMVPRCLRDIFENIATYGNVRDESDENQVEDLNTNSKFASGKPKVFISFVEIYNEKVYDLLSTDYEIALPGRGFKSTGGTRHQIATLHDFHAVFERGTKLRHVRPTLMNTASSRSHAIFTIHVHSDKFESRLNVVDLAGSEGVRRTCHQGIAMAEGVSINQGLLCLNKVLQALNAGHKMIPYRDSVLTSVLQDSLNARSFLTLLACISPDSLDQMQTISTLRFAQTARQLKHAPELNAILNERKKTPQQSIGFKRPLYCSTMQKQAKVSEQSNKTICSASKRSTLHRKETLKRTHSEIGLTPNAKKKAMANLKSTMQPLTIADFHEQPTESLFDLNGARGSLMDLNMSTSTTIDAPTIGQTNSVTQMPQLQDYLKQFERNMMKNMQEFFKAMLNTIPHDSIRPTTAMETSTTATAMNNETIRKAPSDRMVFAEVQTNMPIMSMTNARCQLFPVVSPIFKVPASLPQAQKPIDWDQQNKENPMLTDSILAGGSNLTLSGVSHLTSIQNVSNALSVRRSIRIAAKRIADKTKEDKTTTEIHAKKSKTVAKRKQETPETPVNIRLKNHRKGILDLFNNGTTRQMQQLPRIGAKAANEIVTHRTMVGKFKSLSQIRKLPVWRGNAWERFAKANVLT